MAVETIKSAPIINLDATPAVPNTEGEGATARLKQVQGFVTASAAASIASKYLLARIPSNAKVKDVILESEAQAAGATDVGLYYSDSTIDGTSASLQGTVISAAFFGSAVSLAAASRASIVNESGTYTLDKRNQPIWQAAGLASDPGGFFDVVATLTTAITTGTGKLGAEVLYA